jgi:hypothetical protein
MKSLIAIGACLLSLSAIADENNCNEIKTGFHIYRAQDELREIATCITPRCVKKKTANTEKHFCKAVNACEPIAIELEYPCSEDDKLTPEAKENMKQYMIESVEKIIDYIKSKTGEARQ